MQQNNERLHRFLADDLAVQTVKDIMLETFMKRRDGDVHTKAAQMIAIDMLHESFKEMQARKVELEKQRGEFKKAQIGM